MFNIHRDLLNLPGQQIARHEILKSHSIVWILPKQPCEHLLYGFFVESGILVPPYIRANLVNIGRLIRLKSVLQIPEYRICPTAVYQVIPESIEIYSSRIFLPLNDVNPGEPFEHYPYPAFSGQKLRRQLLSVVYVSELDIGIAHLQLRHRSLFLLVC